MPVARDDQDICSVHISKAVFSIFNWNSLAINRIKTMRPFQVNTYLPRILYERVRMHERERERERERGRGRQREGRKETGCPRQH